MLFSPVVEIHESRINQCVMAFKSHADLTLREIVGVKLI